jgi:thiol-disulfide isomerase/thioredoxin
MRTSLSSLVVVALSVLAWAAPVGAFQDEEYGKDVELKVGNTITHFKASEWVKGPEVKRLDKSKVYVVDIWSSAAQGCKRSIPMMHELGDEFGHKGLEIVGFTVDDPKVAKAYMDERAAIMTYPVGVMKDGGGGQAELWRKIARSGAIPVAAVVNRSGQVCFVGSPFDDKFMRVLKLALADRYDTDLMKQAEPIVAAARRAAKVRNFREASRLYEQVVDLNPRHFADVALENWRMIADQQMDAAAAKEYIRAFIERLGTDTSSLVFVGEYLATNTEMRTRDLEAAGIVADKLRKVAPGDADALACIAATQAANGAFEDAADTQYDAWMAATPRTKAAFKRSLDLYRRGKTAPPSSEPDGSAAQPETDAAKPAVPASGAQGK